MPLKALCLGDFVVDKAIIAIFRQEKMREQSCHVFVLRSQIIPAATPRRKGIITILKKAKTSTIWQRPPKCSIIWHMLWSGGLSFLVSIQGHARGGRGREGCEGSGGVPLVKVVARVPVVVGLHGPYPSTGASKRLCGTKCFLMVLLV